MNRALSNTMQEKLNELDYLSRWSGCRCNSGTWALRSALKSSGLKFNTA